ncbi:MAG: hypothetical protein OXB84_04610, partial [Halobacteriovoraceae bacterium]|nr:hypothetical protein [Halobacteriovoraceae bacterium]
KNYLENLYPERRPYKVLSMSSAIRLKRMMKETLRRGTAKSIFRKIDAKLKKNLELGGKTGSITGGEPFGKRDWFIMYAIPKEGDDLGISIAVMNINVKKWFVKSAHLALKVVEKYYQNNLKKGVILGDNNIGL